MKTELVGNNTDPIWASNVELLSSEESLPIIGSCQVSSILQNLDTTHNDQSLHSMDLIILHGNDYKLPLDAPLDLHTNSYIILKDAVTVEHGSNSPVSVSGSCNNFGKQCSSVTVGNGTKMYTASHKPVESKNLEPTDLSLNIIETSNSSNTSSISPKHYDRESFEDMLYFVCNLCPFLCTKETNITEHLETVHKNKTLSKLVQLKCPACANIFYHRASLKSHLLHDHCVASSDLNLIVQAVLFYSNKENKKEEVSRKVEETQQRIKSTEKKGNAEKVTENISYNKNNDNGIDQNKNKDKDAINLVKRLKTVQNPSNNKASNKVNSVGGLQESSNHIIAKTSKVNPQRLHGSSTPEKIPLPQMDKAADNSEKLITNLMKNSELSVVKYFISQKCAYDACKVTLSDPKKMDYHIECHWTGGYRCLECQEKFVVWKPLVSHLWQKHKIDMELFACDMCDYKTYNLSKLNTTHKLIHSNVKAFKCDICQKAFKNQKQLKNHKQIHKPNVNKEPQACELCNKIFFDKRRLKNHMDIVHKKLKPFLCNYCGYKGSCRASLKMHIRSHTGEKPFACDQCHYTTADHNSLRRHKKRHTGQKPYKCSYCSYACIQSTTYKVHLKTKHPGMEKDLMFTCFICSFRTVNRDMYNSHLFTVHKQKPSSCSINNSSSSDDILFV